MARPVRPRRGLVTLTRRREAATLAEAVRRALAKAVTLTACLALGAMVATLASDLVTETRPPAGDVMAERPTAEGSPSAAMAEAERRGLTCWHGDAPTRYAEAVPTHVVWQRPSGHAVVSSRLVGPALDTLFGDGSLAGQPIAFCHS